MIQVNDTVEAGRTPLFHFVCPKCGNRSKDYVTIKPGVRTYTLMCGTIDKMAEGYPEVGTGYTGCGPVEVTVDSWNVLREKLDGRACD